MHKALPIALQLYSIRELAERDLFAALEAAKELGYDGVEFAGFFGHPAEKVRGKLRELGLIPLSSHAKMFEIFPDYQGFVEYHRTLGAPYIAIAWLPPESRPGAPEYDRFLRDARLLLEECRRAGITLLYHNHEFEFERMADGRLGLDDLFAQLTGVQAELDTCWITVGGERPGEYLRRYCGRCPVVHLKDFLIGPEGRAAKLYHKLEREGRLESRFIGPEDFDFRPVGQGMLDLPAVLEASDAIGALWYVVEQDRSSDRPALQSARESLRRVRAELAL